MAFLELKGVSKDYGSGARRAEVLHDVSLEIERGEFVAVVGRSGSGKTTLLSIAAGLLKPSSGSVLANGRPVTGPGADRAVVFQNYSLLPWLSVFDNVRLAVDQIFKTETSAQKKERVLRYLALVNLSDAIEKRPSQLSGGMRQRVAIARALAMEPEALLMDEPLSALDALTRATLQDEFERVARTTKKTTLLITNDVDEGLLIADRIVPLLAGPRATLGKSIPVPFERPRSRLALQRDPAFRRIREQVVDLLLESSKKAAPHIEPAPLARFSEAFENGL